VNSTAPTNTAAGLTTREALARLRREGPNAIPHPDQRHWPRLVWEVLREPMLLLLIAASALYMLLGDTQEAMLLALSVTMVVGLTVYQEIRSERALQALRDLSSPRARVRRDDEIRILSARDLVTGDLILIAEGDRIRQRSSYRRILVDRRIGSRPSHDRDKRPSSFRAFRGHVSRPRACGSGRHRDRRRY
jgi:P-type Ca2+ transporter type 2C